MCFVRLSKWMTCLVATLFSVGVNASELGDGYLLGEGDTLNIQVFDENVEGLFTVSEDEVSTTHWTGGCAGRNRREFRRKIAASLGARFVRPQIQVSVKVYGSQPVQVLPGKGAGFGTPQSGMAVLDVIGEAVLPDRGLQKSSAVPG